MEARAGLRTAKPAHTRDNRQICSSGHNDTVTEKSTPKHTHTQTHTTQSLLATLQHHDTATHRSARPSRPQAIAGHAAMQPVITTGTFPANISPMRAGEGRSSRFTGTGGIGFESRSGLCPAFTRIQIHTHTRISLEEHSTTQRRARTDRAAGGTRYCLGESVMSKRKGAASAGGAKRRGVAADDAPGMFVYVCCVCVNGGCVRGCCVLCGPM